MTIRLSKEQAALMDKLKKKLVTTNQSEILKRGLVELARKEGL